MSTIHHLPVSIVAPADYKSAIQPIQQIENLRYFLAAEGRGAFL